MKRKTNYRAMFFSGIAFMGAGVALSVSIGAVGISLIGLGVIFMAVGLSHKDEWEQPK